MLISFGSALEFECAHVTPMILNLNVHYSRASDLVRPDNLITDPSVPMAMYRDAFGNWRTRTVAPPGRFRVSTEGLIRDTGEPDPICAYAFEHTVDSLPDETLPFLLPSRYCETELLAPAACSLFGSMTPGWDRIQAICDFVHEHISFDFQRARPSKTAWEVYNEPRGICRDYTHLAIALCRALNIPARYCSGYLGDVGVTTMPFPTEFASWMEVYLAGSWHIFDPCNNQRRVGRVLIARGQDAADVAASMSFGPNLLKSLKVWTHEVQQAAA
jgi:transglutaminase-like putative cysteine protease